MARRLSPAARLLVAALGAAALCWAATCACARTFLAATGPHGAALLRPPPPSAAISGLAAGAASAAPARPPARASSASAGASALAAAGCCLVAVAVTAAAAAARRSKPVPSHRAAAVVRRAEAEDEEEGSSILGALRKADEEESAEEAKIEQENKRLEEEFNMTLSEESLEGSSMMKEETAEEAARRGARQITYKLRPSKNYVVYIAKQNAIRRWKRDGPDGKNTSCLEVVIALLTERIRAMVLHCREFPKDFGCRRKLQMLVGRRRKYLDKLSWSNISSYLKVRDELKIRHTYRMEALVGRLGAYKYAARDRPVAPGRKTSMRMKKQAKLLSGRLARKLRQGRPPTEIFKVRKSMQKRRWSPRAYDEVANMLAGKETGEFVEPLTQERL